MAVCVQGSALGIIKKNSSNSTLPTKNLNNFSRAMQRCEILQKKKTVQSRRVKQDATRRKIGAISTPLITYLIISLKFVLNSRVNLLNSSNARRGISNRIAIFGSSSSFVALIRPPRIFRRCASASTRQIHLPVYLASYSSQYSFYIRHASTKQRSRRSQAIRRCVVVVLVRHNFCFSPGRERERERDTRRERMERCLESESAAVCNQSGKLADVDPFDAQRVTSRLKHFRVSSSFLDSSKGGIPFSPQTLERNRSGRTVSRNNGDYRRLDAVKEISTRELLSRSTRYSFLSIVSARSSNPSRLKKRSGLQRIPWREVQLRPRLAVIRVLSLFLFLFHLLVLLLGFNCSKKKEKKEKEKRKNPGILYASKNKLPCF